MAVRLSRLCINAEKTYGIKLIAGGNGLDSYVRWVHIIEDKEVPDFLSGNELIFTTGIAQTGPNWLLNFVKGCGNANSCGIVLNIGPYIKSVPPHVIVYCEENNLPLYTVPWEVHLIDMTYDFCHRIISSEEKEIGLATALKNAIFTPLDEDQYIHVLERRGFHRDSQYTAAVINFSNKNGQATEGDGRGLRFSTNKVMSKVSAVFGLFFQERKLVIIVKDGNAKKIHSALTYIADYYGKKGMTIKVGIGPARSGYENISDSYFKAMATLKICMVNKTNILSYEKLGIYKLIISINDKTIMREFYNENLQPLIKFDDENATDYVDTLKVYLEQDSSVQRVAAITNCHRNTINYKIKKIKEILGCELTSDDKLKLILAFYIKDFI